MADVFDDEGDEGYDSATEHLEAKFGVRNVFTFFASSLLLAFSPAPVPFSLLC